jgi:hypothetical protein
MESCLDSCTHRIEEFQRILEKIAVDVSDSKWKRLKKSVETVLKEKEVIELFANLEREKSCLVLCIAEIDSCVLPKSVQQTRANFLLDPCCTLLVST